MKAIITDTSCDALHAATIALCREAGVKRRWAEVFVAEGDPTIAADYARQTVSICRIATQLEAAAFPGYALFAGRYVSNKVLDELDYQRVSRNRT